MFEECMWCKGKFPHSSSSTHEYIESTSGCWDAFNGILEKEYSNQQLFQFTNRLTVDTYAVQHPGKPSRKAIQSVIGHLVSLYYVFEKDFSHIEATKELSKFVDKKHPLKWLDPPLFSATLKVSDVLLAKSSEEHIQLVRQWAFSVWVVWKEKHFDTILGWIKLTN